MIHEFKINPTRWIDVRHEGVPGLERAERLAGEYIRGGVAGRMIEAEGVEGRAHTDGCSRRPAIQEPNADRVFTL